MRSMHHNHSPLLGEWIADPMPDEMFEDIKERWDLTEEDVGT